MKKYFMYCSALALSMGMMFSSCDTKSGGGEPEPTKEYRLKTLTFMWNWENTDEAKAQKTSWTYTYDAQKRVSKVVETGEDWTEEFNFDYTTAGQVTVKRVDATKNRVWKLNDKGLVTKIENIWGDGGHVTFDYDADGYMTKAYEDYGTPELKSTFTIGNGNVLSFTRGTRSKNFVYSSGDNLGKIYQVVNDSFIDDWKAHTGMFGAPCKKLNVSLSWSDTPEKVTQLMFDFYPDGRVQRVKRSGSDWFEYYVYEYEEIVQ